jgi:hypothetical protein
MRFTSFNPTSPSSPRAHSGRRKLTTLSRSLLNSLLPASLAIAQLGPANPCPPVGADTNCGVVITILQAGNTACPSAGCYTISNNQGPYDGIDDTLIGIVNNSNLPITSVVLSSGPGGTDIFGFDGDGICGISTTTNLPFAPAPPACPYGPTGYEGPGTSFSNISADQTTGTVTFNPPIPPASANGGQPGTAYFSLENDLTAATACSTIINNSVPNPPNLGGSGLLNGYTTIITTFTPNSGYTLQQAAQLCGFTAFNWVQTITHIPDPNPFCAFNTDPSVPNPSPFSCEEKSLSSPFPLHLTSKSAPYNDPPQNGYTYGFYNSFPFYYPANQIVSDTNNLPAPPKLCAESANGNCILYAVDPTGTALHAFDAPADACISESALGITVASPAYLLNPAIQAACGNSYSGAGEYIGFTTHLAGINAAGMPVDTGVGYDWKSNYNGTFGGISTTGSTGPVDPGSGNGGTTVTNVSETTNYQYPLGVGITTINGNTIAPSSSSSTLLPGDQISVTASGLAYSRVSQTFNGNVSVTNTSGTTLTGPFESVLNSLTVGVTLTNATSSFGGWPYVAFTSTNVLAPNQSTSVSGIQFSNPANSIINFAPVTYSGSFN